MSTYLVSYDLFKQKDYSKLGQALNALKARRVLLSVWTFTSNMKTAQVRDHLKSFIDSDDRLVVVRYDDWATRHALAKPH